MEKLKQEVGQAVDAMNRAAAKIAEQKQAAADLKAQLDASQSALKAAQDAAAAGGDVTAQLDELANQLDGAQTNLDSVISASSGAAEALIEGASAGEAAAETATTVDPNAPTG